LRVLYIDSVDITLTEIEARVLGALVEKEITTPEYYPLSLNALINACNQKSNREPAMHLGAEEVRQFLSNLATKQNVAASTQNQHVKASLTCREQV